jgi:hypothetical protein
MTADQSSAAPSDEAARVPAFDAAIGAVYRIALGRPGAGDVFERAAVRWTDLILPVIVAVAIGVGSEIASDAQVRHAMNLSLAASVKMLSLLAGGILLRSVVALGATWVIGNMASTRERIWPGLLAYQWTQAAFVMPLVILARNVVDPHGSTLAIVLGIGLAIAIVGGSTRVMHAVFKVGYGAAIALALGGNVVSYLTDQLLFGIIFR